MNYRLLIGLIGVFVVLGFLAYRSDKDHNRLNQLEKIVGFETPAALSWTNGHTYATVVKHSANCPCVKK